MSHNCLLLLSFFAEHYPTVIQQSHTATVKMTHPFFSRVKHLFFPVKTAQLTSRTASQPEKKKDVAFKTQANKPFAGC